jgi:hypothetical protein
MRLAIVGALFASVGCCCCGFFFGVPALRDQLAQRSAGLGPACSGSPVPGAAPYVAGGPQRVAVIESVGGGWQGVVGAQLPLGVHADSPSTATLVLCLDADTQVTLETCDYPPDTTLRRVAHERHARLVVAQTGVVLADEALRGSAPTDCPPILTDSGQVVWEGGQPTAERETMQAFLGRFGVL